MFYASNGKWNGEGDVLHSRNTLSTFVPKNLDFAYEILCFTVCKFYSGL